MMIQQGNTQFWVINIIDTSTNSLVDPDTTAAKLYDAQHNVVNDSLPITKIGIGNYQVEVDTTSLSIAQYILEFSYTIGGINKLRRETLSIVFV